VTASRTSREWIDLLTEKGVPCGEIYKVDEVFADPQVKHLGIAQEARTIPFGATRLVGQPVVMTRTPSRIVQHPPERGEHTREVLAELGYDEDSVNDLRARQII